MKKKVLLGISILTICTIVGITKVDFNANKESGLVLSNMEAYASDTEGGKWKCYGPKPGDHCLCQNDVDCRDLQGCR